MRGAGPRAGPTFTGSPEEQKPVYSVLVVYRATCIHRLFFKMFSVVFRCTGHLSVSTLRPALTEFITKKMSGGEEKQGDRRRSTEGQCTKQSRKVKLRKESYCCHSSVNWKVLGGDMGGGIGISDYIFEGKKDRRVGSTAPMENLFTDM